MDHPSTPNGTPNELYVNFVPLLARDAKRVPTRREAQSLR